MKGGRSKGHGKAGEEAAPGRVVPMTELPCRSLRTIAGRAEQWILFEGYWGFNVLF